jgi:hypothetical protein
MKKGKLYINGTLIILCTDDQDKSKRQIFEGVVVHQANKDSKYQFGNYSKSWITVQFKEFPGFIMIKNN